MNWKPVTSPPTHEAIYLVWHNGGPEGSVYLPGFETAFYSPSNGLWDPTDNYGPLADACEVTHWAEVTAPA